MVDHDGIGECMTEVSTADRTRRSITERVQRLGAVAVVRLHSTEAAIRVADALHAGGVTALEITVTVPDAFKVIAAVARRFGEEVCVGVGTVLDVPTVERAVEAGAQYVVSPVFRSEVIVAAHRLGVPAMPGAITPTEMLDAHDAGADVVKLFPADTFGPGYIRSVLAPMPFLRLMPTGGVTPDNVGSWLHAGAVAVGLGGALVDASLVAKGDWDTITARARRVTDGVAKARDTGGAQ
ncbi:MAG: 2-dehydro-3-deoxyphosphogluconate aldolase/4-hydroxy-2-oxoglutarate aldolase [Gemmatimonadetes bacterium]|jgi:2-dehydro-3-deoxyphosphogluconate aldolase/(4S)-4-hydroxy-2-oxoglutarate aldolase|nr:2-dehydro-3-deoxyphosphogluconate aldolase/4-hydroxy-2-oxoglutarate aldolase [Gemmatimonadota bacterium]